MPNLLQGALCQNTDQAFAWRNGAFITRAKFQHDVACAASVLRELAPGSIALYETDCYRCCVWLFSAWHTERCVILAGDNTPTTTDKVRSLSVALVGEFANADINDWQQATPSSLNELSPELPAVGVFTSGSTGEAQIIVKTIAQLDNEIRVEEGLFGQKALPEACVFSTVSQQHVYGLLFRLLWPLVSGRPFATHALLYPEQLQQILAEHKSIVLISSPAFLKRLPDSFDFSLLRQRCCLIFSSGGALPASAWQNIYARSGTAICEIFGSSETGGIAWRDAPNKAWSPLPEVQVKQGAQNQLQLRSPYLPSAEWFFSADRIQLEKNGTFHLLGRADRIVKIEEKRVSLTAIEKFLLSSDLVNEARLVVLEGSRVELGAVVVLTPQGQEKLQLGQSKFSQELRRYLAQSFERVALPRRWRFVNALPQNSMGKTSESDMKQLFQRPSLPQVIVTDKNAEEAQLTLHIDANLIQFDGHFSKQAILPGVAQIHWAIHFARQLFDLPPEFKGMDAIKFQNIIFPASTISLKLRYQADKQKLTFSYTNNELVHASGRISFGAEA